MPVGEPAEPDASAPAPMPGDAGPSGDSPDGGGVAAPAVGSGGPADIAFAAGESPIIHDADAPTAVRIRFGSGCAGLGTLEVTGRQRIPPAQGTGSAVVTLAAGLWSYRVRCPDESGAERVSSTGNITVRRDTGAAALAKRVAHNLIETDGRNYTILYQNRLPSITVRWRDAPAGRGFTLHLRAQHGGDRSVSTGAASHTFASGDVAEGRYTLWFESSGGVRSQRTALRLGFDNAAPAATIRDVPGAPDGLLRLTGTLEEGWAATVDDAPLPVDGHRRFTTDLRARPGADTAVIRLSKPGRDVHYYVRRIAAPP